MQSSIHNIVVPIKKKLVNCDKNGFFLIKRIRYNNSIINDIIVANYQFQLNCIKNVGISVYQIAMYTNIMMISKRLIIKLEILTPSSSTSTIWKNSLIYQLIPTTKPPKTSQVYQINRLENTILNAIVEYLLMFQ
ncbi:hypothetical protein ABPG73_008874 [Tetrahymena malaccensis]